MAFGAIIKTIMTRGMGRRTRAVRELFVTLQIHQTSARVSLFTGSQCLQFANIAVLWLEAAGLHHWKMAY
jgi:hypothetical protein